MHKKRITIGFLLVLTLFALYLCYRLFQPFLYPLLSALVIAIVFFPVHARMHMVFRKPGVAALMSTLLVTLIIIIPAILIFAAVTKEVSGLVAVIDQKSTESGGFSPYVNHLIEGPMNWISQYIDLSQFNLSEAIRSRLEGLSRFLLAQLANIVGGVTSFIVDSVITIFTLFFLFREGRSLRRRVAAILPLTPSRSRNFLAGSKTPSSEPCMAGLSLRRFKAR